MFALPPGWKGLHMENFPGPVRSEPTRSASYRKQDGRVCHRPPTPTPRAHGEGRWGRRVATEPRPQHPRLRSPRRKTSPGSDRASSSKPFAPKVYRPGFGRTTHGKGTTSQPEARKCFPWSVAAADVGTPPSCPQQDGTSESKQNRGQCKGLLGLSQRE